MPAAARPRACARSSKETDMAQIVAGVASSHVPLLGVAVDQGKTQDDYFKPIFDGYEWTREWEAREKPDVVILVYNDHASYFDMKIIPTFAIGCGERFRSEERSCRERVCQYV